MAVVVGGGAVLLSRGGEETGGADSQAVTVVAADTGAGGQLISAPASELASEEQPGGTIVAPTPVPTAAPTTAVVTTVVPSTIPTTTTSPAEVARSWQGTYNVIATVTEGNDSIAAGTASEFDAAFVARCTGGDCVVRSPAFFNKPWRVGSRSLSLRTTITEACPNNPAVSITDTVRITLTVAARDADGIPTRITGTQTTSAPQAARCGDGSVNQPVTYSYEITRAS